MQESECEEAQADLSARLPDAETVSAPGCARVHGSVPGNFPSLSLRSPHLKSRNDNNMLHPADLMGLLGGEKK